MATYVVHRLLQSVLVLLLVSLTLFALLRSVPEDVLLRQLAQAAALSPDDLARARQELGLERPFWRQYTTWLGGVLQGDLGRSLSSKRAVSQALGERATLTLHLLFMALIVALLLAIPVGILTALWHHTLTDYLGRMLALAAISCPDFWLAIVAMIGMALWWHGMPPTGFTPLWVNPSTCIAQLLMPAAVIGVRLAARLMRLTRATLLDIRCTDDIRTARARGLRERTIMVQQGLKNATAPVVTLIGQQCSLLLGGAVVVEVIFVLPGVGNLTLDAVMLRDYTMMQGAVMFFAGAMLSINFLVDISDAWFDPHRRSTRPPALDIEKDIGRHAP